MLDFTGPALPLPAESTVVTTPRKGERRRGARLGFGQQLVLLSWNLLAPPYKRMGGGVREAELSDTWHARVLSQIEYVRSVEPDIVSLQEFWCAEPGFVAMWASFCEEEGYHMLTTQRTSGKADGLCVLVREHIELELGVGVHASFSFNDWGDRIVQVVRIPVDDEFLAVINTHLTFPHANNHDGPSELLSHVPSHIGGCGERGLGRGEMREHLRRQSGSEGESARGRVVGSEGKLRGREPWR